jgi:hypothetical protein
MIHADFTFALFKDGFNRSSHFADPHEFIQGGIEGSIGKKVFDLGRIIQIASDDQPEFGGGQTSTRFGHAQKSKITNDGTLAAFLDHRLSPILLLDLLHQILDWNGMLSFITQSQATGMTSVATPGWQMNFGWATPDQAVILDGREVRLSSRRHAIPKREAGHLPPARKMAIRLAG